MIRIFLIFYLIPVSILLVSPISVSADCESEFQACLNGPKAARSLAEQDRCFDYFNACDDVPKVKVPQVSQELLQQEELNRQKEEQRRLEELEQQRQEQEQQQEEQRQYEEQKRVDNEFNKLQNRLASEIIDEYNRLTGNNRNPTEAEIKKLLRDLQKIKNEWNNLLKEGKLVGIEYVDIRKESGEQMSIDKYAKELERHLNEYLDRTKTESVEKSSLPVSKSRTSKPKPKLEAGKKLTDLDLNLLNTLKLPAAKLLTAQEKADFIQAKREIQNSAAEFIRKNGGTLAKALKTSGGADYLKALQQEVLKQNPTDINANLMLGKIYKEEGNGDIALEFNKKSLGNIDNKEALEFIDSKLKELREEKRAELKITGGAFNYPVGKKINKEFEDAAKKAGMGTVRGVAVEQLSRCALSSSNCSNAIDGATNLNQ